MKVALYNRWLSTMGGGEKHLGTIAEVLARHHDVALVTHQPVDLKAMSTTLDLDLGNVTLQIVPEDPSFESVASLSSEYDLFVNGSHLDYFRPRAKQNALVVYFPPASINQAQALGIYNRLKAFGRRNVGRLVGGQLRQHMRRAVFGADGTRSSDQTLLGRLAMSGFRLFTNPTAQADILGGYDVIFAISEFTQKWIDRYWQRPSFVLYPPVDVERLRPGVKRNQILSVGRFFAGNHNKKHLPMIAAFRELHAGPLANWEYHMIGGYSPTESNALYLDAVRRSAAECPAIHLHVNATVGEMTQLYAESKLFWHATGLGEDEDAHPERFEHFGITTVEAMAAGCVPVVIGRAGQIEVVEDQNSGFLWTTVDELKALTLQLAADDPLRAKVAEAAVRRSGRWGMTAFVERLEQALALVRTDGVRDRA